MYKNYKTIIFLKLQKYFIETNSKSKEKHIYNVLLYLKHLTVFFYIY